MTVIYLTIWATWFLLAVMAAWGLGWAVRTGQFLRLQQHASMILEPDDDELPQSLIIAHRTAQHERGKRHE